MQSRRAPRAWGEHGERGVAAPGVAVEDEVWPPIPKGGAPHLAGVETSSPGGGENGGERGAGIFPSKALAPAPAPCSSCLGRRAVGLISDFQDLPPNAESSSALDLTISRRARLPPTFQVG